MQEIVLPLQRLAREGDITTAPAGTFVAVKPKHCGFDSTLARDTKQKTRDDGRTLHRLSRPERLRGQR